MAHASSTEMNVTDPVIVVAELVTDSHFGVFNIADIRKSKTNRKRFNEEALNELAQNIRANGLIQPILIRPVTPTEAEPEAYELVCGERRWRASIIAGLPTINAICRNLSDNQAAELQLIENLQREDPHPLEEAEGYQALMMQSGYTAEMLAEKLNKSKSQIYATLKLCNLCQELRDAFFHNEAFTRSLALLIARIPVPALQCEAYGDIIDEYGNGGSPMSYRDAAEHIQAHYNVHLKTAIFSTTDAKLLSHAGSCKACKKRTGNDPDLADLDKDICTDPKCYEAKCIAHNAKIIERAEENNITILHDKDAQMAISQAINNPGKYAIDSTCLHCFARLKNSADRNKMVSVAIGTDKLPEPIAIAVRNGAPVKLYNSLHIQITLEELGFCETEAKARAKAIEKELVSNADNALSEGDSAEQDSDDGSEDTSTDTLDRAAKQDEENRALNNEEIKRIRIYKAIRARGQLSLESLRKFLKLIEDACVFFVPESIHLDLYGQSMATEDERLTYIDNASCEQLQLLLIDYFIGDVQKPNNRHRQNDYINRTDEDFQTLKSIAEHEGIDIAIAEQEPASPIQSLASEPKQEVPVTLAPKKRGRKPVAVAAVEETNKGNTELTSKKPARPSKEYQALLDAKAAAKKAGVPEPMDAWPFPKTKRDTDAEKASAA